MSHFKLYDLEAFPRLRKVVLVGCNVCGNIESDSLQIIVFAHCLLWNKAGKKASWTLVAAETCSKY
jgi:hypothetical protein